jgi:epsilon-lactone hydrolase
VRTGADRRNLKGHPGLKSGVPSAPRTADFAIALAGPPSALQRALTAEVFSAVMAPFPFLASQFPGLVDHAQRVSRRRLRHGPRLPGWEWPYEVFLSVFRERFNETHLPHSAMRSRMDAVGLLSTDLPLVSVKDVDAGGVPCSLFSVRRPTDRWVFYLHGGAYVFGSPRSHAPLLARLARVTRARVLAVDYRLAPEHPFPAALDDALSAWRWLIDQGTSPRDVTIAGDSAGGGLSLITLLALRDRDMPLPSRAVLLSPWTDLALTGESIARAQHDYLPGADQLETFAAHFHGEIGADDPRVSPLYAPDLDDLPPTLILAGGEESILDDSTRMHQRLRDAKVEADIHIEPHEVHVYPTFASVSRRGREGIERIARFIG